MDLTSFLISIIFSLLRCTFLVWCLIWQKHNFFKTQCKFSLKTTFTAFWMKYRPSPYIKQRRMKLEANTMQTFPRCASLHAFLFLKPSSFDFWDAPPSEPCPLRFGVGFPPSFTVSRPTYPQSRSSAPKSFHSTHLPQWLHPCQPLHLLSVHSWCMNFFFQTRPQPWVPDPHIQLLTWGSQK